jgi:hypothetical protein
MLNNTDSDNEPISVDVDGKQKYVKTMDRKTMQRGEFFFVTQQDNVKISDKDASLDHRIAVGTCFCYRKCFVGPFGGQKSYNLTQYTFRVDKIDGDDISGTVLTRQMFDQNDANASDCMSEWDEVEDVKNITGKLVNNQQTLKMTYPQTWSGDVFSRVEFQPGYADFIQFDNNGNPIF